jgi:osmotically-inducible protein OsmY
MKSVFFKAVIAVFSLTFLTSCIESIVASSVAVGGIATREKSLSDTPKDIVLSTKIASEFLKNGLKTPFDSVDVTVNEGRVLLTGIVSNDDRAGLANDLAWKIEGVKEVIDEIQLNDNKNGVLKRVGKASGDYLTSTKIESKLLFNSKIRSFNYQITTVNGTVYVLGVARNKGELDRVLDIIAKTGGVAKVVNYAILADDTRRGGKAVKKGTYEEEDAEEIKIQ